MSEGWIRVTRANKCPICEHPDWCCIGRLTINCMRVPSPRPAKNGGWLHPIAGEKPVVVPRPVEERPHINATAIMRDWSSSTTRDMLTGFAVDLGLDVTSLVKLGTAWAPPHRAWAFPMKDACGNIIGIRLRDNAGRKWAVSGSRAGLFYGHQQEGGTKLVLEGPTDTAAALSIGMDAIGRPSCVGQENMLCDMLRRADRVLIIADRDTPGLRGAEQLQGMLRCPSLIWCPPAKDLREFVRAGATWPLIQALTKNLVWTIQTTTYDKRRTSGSAERSGVSRRDHVR